MNDNWKPGDIAYGRINDYEGLFVYRGEWNGWDEIGEGGTETGWDSAFIEEFRRLVIIDPEDRAAAERFHDAFYAVSTGDFDPETVRLLSPHHARCQAAFRLLANPTPPKPKPLLDRLKERAPDGLIDPALAEQVVKEWLADNADDMGVTL